MPAKKKGRDRPERIGEPQEDDALAAAQDQTKACPQSVFVDDNPSDFDGQIAGGVPESETGPGGGEERAVEGNLMDTGWREFRGWKVRTIVLGGAPDPRRRSWFAGNYPRK